MPPVSDQKQAIVESALNQFKQFGFKNVTVDDIARSSGISKKTLYEQFEDKDELVYESVRYMLDCKQCEFDEVMKGRYNAIEQLIQIITVMEELIQGMNRVCFQDLQRYYPKAYQYMEAYRKQKMLKDITDNLKQGIEEGLYRDDIAVDVIATFRMESAMMIFHSVLYQNNKMDMLHVNKELFAHYMYGIATIKGHKLISKYLSQK